MGCGASAKKCEDDAGKAAAPAPAPAAAAEAPAEKKEADSAPNLKKAYEFLAKANEKSTDAMTSGQPFDKAGQEKDFKEYQDLLKNAFETHDTKKSGKLNQEQGAVFFGNILRDGAFLEAMAANNARITCEKMCEDVKKTIAEVGLTPAEADKAYPEICKLIEDDFKKTRTDLKTTLEKLKSEYMASKTQMDGAAMKVADRSGAGSPDLIMDLQEFLKMMEFGSPTNTQLRDALGFTDSALNASVQSGPIIEKAKQLSQDKLQEAAQASAPFLKRAFECYVNITDATISAAMQGELPDLDKISKLGAEYEEMLRKSFERHDLDKSGKLDKKQAAIFFGNLLAEGSGFTEAMIGSLSKTLINSFMDGAKQGMPPDAEKHLPAIHKICEDDIKGATSQIAKFTDEKKADYRANKAEKDAAAMVLADTDGNGGLDIEEFMKMMNPEEDVNKRLMETLGLVVDPEQMMASVDMEGIAGKVQQYLAENYREGE